MKNNTVALTDGTSVILYEYVIPVVFKVVESDHFKICIYFNSSGF